VSNDTLPNMAAGKASRAILSHHLARQCFGLPAQIAGRGAGADGFIGGNAAAAP
jgi:hypothetical protein